MVNKDITLRELARRNGQAHYKSDSVCVHGHKDPWRNTDSGGCRVCLKAKHEYNRTPLHYDLPLKTTVKKPKPKVEAQFAVLSLITELRDKEEQRLELLDEVNALQNDIRDIVKHLNDIQ